MNALPFAVVVLLGWLALSLLVHFAFFLPLMRRNSNIR